MSNEVVETELLPCPVCKYHWNLIVLPGQEHNRNCPHADDREKGCVCQSCFRRYKVDVQVDDALWKSITPEAENTGAGLLCGRCIFQRIEGLGEFDALVLTRDDYVAWCRYVCHGQHEDSGADIITIEVCDSDVKGAFKVYARALLPSTPISQPAEPEDDHSHSDSPYLSREIP